MLKDVTQLVEYGDNDGDFMPITKCVCGHKYELYKFNISTDYTTMCDNCGRKFYFSIGIKVWEVD